MPWNKDDDGKAEGPKTPPISGPWGQGPKTPVPPPKNPWGNGGNRGPGSQPPDFEQCM